MTYFMEEKDFAEHLIICGSSFKALTYHIYNYFQVTCGAELAVLFVEALVKGKFPYDDDTVGQFFHLILFLTFSALVPLFLLLSFFLFRIYDAYALKLRKYVHSFSCDGIFSSFKTILEVAYHWR